MKEVYLLPMIIALAVVPLIVRLKLISLSDEIYLLWNGKDINPDFFSYYKGIFLIVNGVIAALIYFLTMKRESCIRIKEQKKYYIAAGSFLLLMLLSSLLSDYRYLSLSGSPDRYEGIYVWMAYIGIFWYAMNYPAEEKSNKILIYAIYLMLLLMSLIGLSQYIGRDIFKLDFVQNLIIPSEYKKYQASMTVAEYGVKSIYGTSYHYNYIGSFTAMIFGFSLILALFYRDPKVRLCSVVAAILSLLLLLGSSARSGVIGLVVVLLVLGLFFFRKAVRSKKAILGILTTLILLIALLVLPQSREVLYRLPSLGEDIKSVFTPSSETDYRDQIELQGVDVKQQSLWIRTKSETLEYRYLENRFYDELGKEVSMQQEETNTYRLDAPYQEYRISTMEDKVRQAKYLRIMKDSGIQLYFKESQGQLSIINPNGMEVVLEEAESIGFKGKEKLGSARGYIWSRTLPLLKKALVLGYGSDTFLAIFPQGDVYAKLYVYGHMWTVVDKPHNLFLQIAVNSGVLSLLIFLTLIGMLAVSMYRRYAAKKERFSSEDALTIACFMGVVGYLSAGFFNDSVVSVAPIFWVLLGMNIRLLALKQET